MTEGLFKRKQVLRTGSSDGNEQGESDSWDRAGGVLDNYVEQAGTDPRIRVNEQYELATGGRCHHLSFVSQRWRGKEWTHRLSIIEPPALQNEQITVLYITGDSHKPEVEMFTDHIDHFPYRTAVLSDIPNQPLLDGLREDALIAHTFINFLESGDTGWPLLLPMTRGAVAAMQVVEEYLKQDSSFVVSGASKRGWTTWLTAAVDNRVKALVPIVYDNLNLKAQLQHQLEFWGDYSEQIHDYTERNLPELLPTPEGRDLVRIVDPYCYRHRILQPKLILQGTNDPYWPLDASNLYFDRLQGPTYLDYLPNQGHSLHRRSILYSLAALTAAAAGDYSLPRLDWAKREAGKEKLEIILESSPTPLQVRAWTAEVPECDFRWAEWHSHSPEQNRESCARYSWNLESAAGCWRTAFLKARYPLPFGGFHSLSTQLGIAAGRLQD